MSVGPWFLGLLLSAFFFAGLTGDAGVNTVAGVGLVAWSSGMLALSWWMGALGYGLVLARLVRSPSVQAITSAASGRGYAGAEHTGLDTLAIALGLGSALMLVVDAAIGSLGLMMVWRGALAWSVVASGVVAGVIVLRDAPLGEDDADVEDAARLPRNARLACGFAVGALTGLLAVAASVAPGWLWSSEFAGYDALSYHLVLPKMWFFAGGSVGPIDGNVYSALPSYVESAFLHLMVLRGNPFDGAFACQWWSLCATLATAFCIARLARACLGAASGWIAAIVFLATPWTTVVGTLAYNDMYPCLALAAGWLLVGPVPDAERRLDVRMAAGLALLAAAAFGAKPSSVLFTALPLCVIVWFVGGRTGGLRNYRFAPVVVAVGLVLLAPWLVRNQLHYGSPTFPFLSGIFGLGPWSAEQMSVFQNAHGSPGPLQSTLPLVWQQWLGYGIGDPPAPTEPWFPLWGALPVVGIAGLAFALKPQAVGQNRHWAIAGAVLLLVMLGGWLLMTHVKSRFLLPSAVPLALGATALLLMIARRTKPAVAVSLTLAAAAMPAFTFMREPVRGAQELHAPALLVNGTAQRTGEVLAQAMQGATREQQAEMLRQADSAFVVNYVIPKEEKIVGIGFSTPFYLARPVGWCTVWDRGAFDKVVEESPGTPEVWGRKLRALGFTYAIIDPTMLSVWTRSGWLNPALAGGTWAGPFASSNTRFAETVDGKIILLLAPPQAMQPPPTQQPVAPLGTPPSPETGSTPGLNGGLLSPPLSGGK